MLWTANSLVFGENWRQEERVRVCVHTCECHSHVCVSVCVCACMHVTVLTNVGEYRLSINYALSQELSVSDTLNVFVQDLLLKLLLRMNK